MKINVQRTVIRKKRFVEISKRQQCGECVRRELMCAKGLKEWVEREENCKSDIFMLCVEFIQGFTCLALGTCKYGMFVCFSSVFIVYQIGSEIRDSLVFMGHLTRLQGSYMWSQGSMLRFCVTVFCLILSHKSANLKFIYKNFKHLNKKLCLCKFLCCNW